MRNFYYRQFIISKLGGKVRRGFYNDPPVVDPPTDGKGGGNDDPLNKKVDLTQKQLNDLIAAERRKEADRNKATVAELEKVKQTAGLSAQQVSDLQNQITELEKTYMSQAELAKRDAEKSQKEYAAKLESESKRAMENETRFKNLLVKNAITSASLANDAYNAEQMLTQLSGLAKVVPVTLDGKETGDFEVKIAFPDKTKEGQPVVLELTADETLKRMKEIPEKYGNLFKSGVSGGVGGNNNGPSGNNSNDLNTVTADPETYRKSRKNLLK